jgi:hypothetical protein
MEEGAWRARRHEQLTREALPDQRRRLTAAEDELRRRAP